MDCSTIRQKIADYIDSTLAPDERKQVEGHLSTCEQCRLYAADITKTIETMKKLEEMPPPPWLTGKVMERIRSEARPKKGLIQRLFFPLQIKLPIGAAATLLIAVAAVLMVKGMGPDLKRVASVKQTPEVRTAPAEKEALPEDRQEKYKTGQKAEKAPAPEARLKQEIPSSQAPVVKQQPAQASPAPAPAPPAPVRELAAKDSAEQVEEQKVTESGTGRSRLFAEKKASEIPSVTLLVSNRDKAVQEIGAILSKLGGSIRTADKQTARTTLTIELSLSQRKTFLEQIRSLGSIKESHPAPEIFTSNQLNIVIINK